MKKIFKPLLLIVLSLFVLTGCSSFFGGDNNGIDIKQGEDGSVIITIIDENGEEKSYTVKRGVGISDVQEVPNPSEGFTNLIFLFDNGLIDPHTIKIPYPKDGREVKMRVNKEKQLVEYQYEGDPEDEWQPLFNLEDVDGKSAYEVYLSLLEEGVEPLTEQEWLASLVGKSAYQIYCDNTDNPLSETEWLKTLIGKSAYEIYVDNAQGKVMTVEEWLESLRGEKGKEVASIKSMNGAYAYQDALNQGFFGSEQDWLREYSGLDDVALQGLEASDFNVFVFTYNDETVSDPVFNLRPGGKWYSGKYNPNSKVFGIAGDYYFESAHETIYFKDTTGVWKEVASLNPNKETARVYFHLNDSSDAPAYMPADDAYNKDYFEVIKGSYFRGGEYNNPEIPVPTREGYEFIGWYRYEKLPANFNPYIHMPFNDFSVVAEDALHLYAQWKKI